MINFKNKKILVTGATGGIGREIVKKFTSLEGNILATKRAFLMGNALVVGVVSKIGKELAKRVK